MNGLGISKQILPAELDPYEERRLFASRMARTAQRTRPNHDERQPYGVKSVDNNLPLATYDIDHGGKAVSIHPLVPRPPISSKKHRFASTPAYKLGTFASVVKEPYAEVLCEQENCSHPEDMGPGTYRLRMHTLRIKNIQGEDYTFASHTVRFHTPRLNTIKESVATSTVKYGGMTSNADRLMSTAAMVHNMPGAPKLHSATTDALGPGTYKSSTQFAHKEESKAKAFTSLLPSEVHPLGHHTPIGRVNFTVQNQLPSWRRLNNAILGMDMSEEGAGGRTLPMRAICMSLSDYASCVDGVDFDYLVELIRSAVGPYVVDENGDPVTPLQLLPRPHSRSQVQDGVVTSDVIPSTATLAQAPFFLRPLSPDCLSPQSRIERVLGPGASLEPRPPARRRHPFDSNNQASPPPRRTRVGHVPPASFNLHTTIFSDESDDEDAQDDDMHNSTLSSVSSDLDTNDDTHHMMHASNGVRSLPHLVFPHLVALGFDAATTLSALQAHFHDLQTLETNGHDESADDDDDGTRSTCWRLWRWCKASWTATLGAQYEFGTSRPGTSFGCVVVVVNLPRVAAAGRAFDAVRQLLLVHLFSMVSNPLQVILPLGPPNATTMKGYSPVTADDLFCKTKAVPSLFYLPVSDDLVARRRANVERKKLGLIRPRPGRSSRRYRHRRRGGNRSSAGGAPLVQA
ncbi:hypothetical protein DYB34_002781 [Aphanomyces astaci]|uniref:Uncharacterized protein n=1 Tax=Aphanomyces astaci TaxID=112090 RepID=A0A3R6WEV6_APHAT|nr:hypothetical protein DYB34_002781 [Aphanomyces astaci]